MAKEAGAAATAAGGLAPGKLATFLLEGVVQGVGAQGYTFLSDLLFGSGDVTAEATTEKLDVIQSQLDQITTPLDTIDTDLKSIAAGSTHGLHLEEQRPLEHGRVTGERGLGDGEVLDEGPSQSNTMACTVGQYKTVDRVYTLHNAANKSGATTISTQALPATIPDRNCLSNNDAGCDAPIHQQYDNGTYAVRGDAHSPGGRRQGGQHGAAVDGPARSGHPDADVLTFCEGIGGDDQG